MTKRKARGEAAPLEVQEFIADPDAYLFADGRSLSAYWVDKATGDGTIGFLHDGREMDLLISNEGLAKALLERLLELGVEVRNG